MSETKCRRAMCRAVKTSACVYVCLSISVCMYVTEIFCACMCSVICASVCNEHVVMFVCVHICKVCVCCQGQSCVVLPGMPASQPLRAQGFLSGIGPTFPAALHYIYL